MQVPRIKRILNQFEPHGPDNMKPVFMSTNVYSTEVRCLKEAHLKLSMTQPNSDLVIEGIGFNLAHKVDLVASGLLPEPDKSYPHPSELLSDLIDDNYNKTFITKNYLRNPDTVFQKKLRTSKNNKSFFSLLVI